MNLRSTIEPYTEYIIDCQQNLIMSILYANHLPVIKLGAVWPWQFHIDINTLEINNTHLITDERLRQLYSFDVQRLYIRENSVLEDIDILLSHQIFPIVNVDQYYIKHHYPHIYLREHGIHSILILNKSGGDAYSIVDCLPAYKGIICANNLCQAIAKLPSDELRYQICYLKKIEFQPLSDDETFCQFLHSACLPDISKQQIFSLQYLYNFLCRCLSHNDTYTTLKKLLNGVWIWEIGRKERITKAYIQSLGQSFLGDYIGDFCKEMDRINDEVILSTRKLFKASLLSSMQQLKSALDIMERACLLEEKLLQKIKMKGEYL